MAVKKNEVKKENAKQSKAESKNKLAIIVVRGNVKVAQTVIDTLHMLNLYRKNHCAVVDDTPSYRGMIDKVKDFVTWGEITDETFQKLVAERGEKFLGRVSDAKNKYTYKFMEYDGKKYKNYFRLNPPRKGFGRKGVKVAFVAGGALGYRGDKINDLIQRML
jgi:large subunit ribosomal protein L30